MKKIIYTLFALAAVISCNEKQVAPEVKTGFQIEISTDSKANIDLETFEVSWKENETVAIRINGDNNNIKTFTRVEDTDIFRCEDWMPEADQSYTYEVFSSNRSGYGFDSFSFSGGVNCIMYGYAATTGTEQPCIYMQHLTSIIRLAIKNTGDSDFTATSYRIESTTGDEIGGTFILTGFDGEGQPLFEKKNPEGSFNFTALASGNDKAIKAGGEAVVLLSCKPFVAKEGSQLKITVTADGKDYIFEKNLTKGYEFGAGHVKKTTVEIAKEVPGPSVGEANKVYIDFGATTTSGDDANKWNTYNKRGTAESDYVDLKNGEWNDSGLRMTTKASFDGTGWKDDGISKTWTENSIVYPARVWRDAMLAKTNPAKLEISGCEKTATYKIESLHIRYNGSRGPRVFDMEVTGKPKIESFDCGMPENTAEGTNTYNIVFDDVTPDENGIINITITPLLGSNSSTKEATINAMIITKK